MIFEAFGYSAWWSTASCSTTRTLRKKSSISCSNQVFSVSKLRQAWKIARIIKTENT